MKMHMNQVTTMDDESYDGGLYADDRDIGADNPDEDVVGTMVAIIAGGARVTTHGFLGNVRVTTGLHQGSTRVASPSAPAECKSSPSVTPARTWQGHHAFHRASCQTPHHIHGSKVGCVGKRCSLPAHREQRRATLLPPRIEVRSASDCCWWCSAHQAVARGAWGTLLCPQRRNTQAFSAPGSRHCHAAATLLCCTSPMAQWTAQTPVLNASDLLAEISA